MQDDLKELIEIAAVSTSLAATVVEKDFYVTKAIQVLASLQDDHFNPIFQGGTALAKAHSVIERMSEDCDFRIQSTEDAKRLNPSQKRNILRKYRSNIIELLRKEGFSLIEKHSKVQDGGNYILLPLQYPSFYGKNTNLRPHLQLELMLNDARLPIVRKNVTTLIRQILGDEVNHPSLSIPCVSVNETAAEKWVALTRRVANAARNPLSFTDPTLVRHIYDLYCIDRVQKINQEMYSLVATLIKQDQIKYKNQNPFYINSPLSEIRNSLKNLVNNKTWADNWDKFLNNMVYGDIKIDYIEAVSFINLLSNHILIFIDKHGL